MFQGRGYARRRAAAAADAPNAIVFRSVQVRGAAAAKGSRQERWGRSINRRGRVMHRLRFIVVAGLLLAMVVPPAPALADPLDCDPEAGQSMPVCVSNPVGDDVPATDIYVLLGDVIPTDADDALEHAQKSGETAGTLAGGYTPDLQDRAAGGYLDGPVDPAGEVSNEEGAVAGLAAKWPGPVIDTWRDSADRVIRLRQRRMEHFTTKHELSVRTVRRTTQVANRYYDDTSATGKTYLYRAWATKWSCGWWNCTKQAQVMIRVVEEHRVLSDGRFYGIVTGYCEGYYWKCPQWVNNHVN